MSVQLTSHKVAKSFPLTSPPPEPKNALDPNWIASEKHYGDRKLWITYPFPDKLNLVADLTDEMTLVPDVSGKSAKQIYYQFDHEISSHLKQYPKIPDDHISLVQLKGKHKPYGAVFQLGPESARLARLELSRRNGQDYPVWKLALTLNPCKVGAQQMLAIPELFENALWMFDFYKFLEATHITRVDCAIDIIGARPIDLICRIENPGKRMAFLDGKYGPESFYWFQKKEHPSAPPKSSNYKSQGPTRLLVYERRARAIQHGFQPPHGKTPVTRVEIKHMWKGAWHPFSSLPNLKNLISGREVAYASQPHLISSPRWRELCERSWSMGADNLSIHSPLAKNLQLINEYHNIEPDLITSKNWIGWAKGLELTGITDWLYNIPKSSN